MAPGPGKLLQDLPDLLRHLLADTNTPPAAPPDSRELHSTLGPLKPPETLLKEDSLHLPRICHEPHWYQTSGKVLKELQDLVKGPQNLQTKSLLPGPSPNISVGLSRLQWVLEGLEVMNLRPRHTAVRPSVCLCRACKHTTTVFSQSHKQPQHFLLIRLFGDKERVSCFQLHTHTHTVHSSRAHRTLPLTCHPELPECSRPVCLGHDDTNASTNFVKRHDNF